MVTCDRERPSCSTDQIASAIVSDLQDFIGPRSLYLKPCKQSFSISAPELFYSRTNLENVCVLIPAFLPHVLELVLVAVGSARHTLRRGRVWAPVLIWFHELGLTGNRLTCALNVFFCKCISWKSYLLFLLDHLEDVWPDVAVVVEVTWGCGGRHTPEWLWGHGGLTWSRHEAIGGWGQREAPGVIVGDLGIVL